MASNASAWPIRIHRRAGLFIEASLRTERASDSDPTVMLTLSQRVDCSPLRQAIKGADSSRNRRLTAGSNALRVLRLCRFFLLRLKLLEIGVVRRKILVRRTPMPVAPRKEF